jgi:hypothetical protein
VCGPWPVSGGSGTPGLARAWKGVGGGRECLDGGSATGDPWSEATGLPLVGPGVGCHFA